MAGVVAHAQRRKATIDDTGANECMNPELIKTGQSEGHSEEHRLQLTDFHAILRKKDPGSDEGRFYNAYA